MQIRHVLFIVGLTLLSGLADSLGFVYASKIWEGRRLVWPELAKSAGGFGVGISAYWLVVRYLKELGVSAPEIQSIFWFAVTIIGVAMLNGRFFQWQLVDKIVALVTLSGIGWLLFRVGD